MAGATGNALTMSDDYLFYISLGAPFALFGAAVPILIRNDEKPGLATAVMATGAILNIILDYIFVVMLQQQVAGAAIATVIAQGITAIWGITYFFSSQANTRLSFSNIRLDYSNSAETLKTGSSSFFMFMYFGFIVALHNWLFMQYGGIVAVGAFTIVGYVQAIYYMIAEGVATGMQPLISYNKGAGRYDNVRLVFFLAMKVVLITGLATVFIVNLFPEAITHIFNNTDQELAKQTVTGLRLHLLTIFLDGFIFASAAYFQSLARASLATAITLGNMLVQIPLVLLLPLWLGVTGIWIAVPISNVFLSAVVLMLLIADFRQRSEQTTQEIPATSAESVTKASL